MRGERGGGRKDKKLASDKAEPRRRGGGAVIEAKRGGRRGHQGRYPPPPHLVLWVRLKEESPATRWGRKGGEGGRSPDASGYSIIRMFSSSSVFSVHVHVSRPILVLF